MSWFLNLEVEIVVGDKTTDADLAVEVNDDNTVSDVGILTLRSTEDHVSRTLRTTVRVKVSDYVSDEWLWCQIAEERAQKRGAYDVRA